MRVNACLGWDGEQGQATPSHSYDGFPYDSTCADQQGLFGPYTKNTMLRSILPGLKRLGTNLAMLVKEGEGAWDKP
jgi:hypothetical protein